MLDKNVIAYVDVFIDGYWEKYPVNASNQILQKGQYFGEMYYTPYFHSKIEDSDGEIIKAGYKIYIFDIMPDEKKDFPELVGFVALYLLVDNLGFVYTRAFTEVPEYNSLDELFSITNNVGTNRKHLEQKGV